MSFYTPTQSQGETRWDSGAGFGRNWSLVWLVRARERDFLRSAIVLIGGKVSVIERGLKNEPNRLATGFF